MRHLFIWNTPSLGPGFPQKQTQKEIWIKAFPLLGGALGNNIPGRNEGGRIGQWELLNCHPADREQSYREFWSRDGPSEMSQRQEGGFCMPQLTATGCRLPKGDLTFSKGTSLGWSQFLEGDSALSHQQPRHLVAKGLSALVMKKESELHMTGSATAPQLCLWVHVLCVTSSHHLPGLWLASSLGKLQEKVSQVNYSVHITSFQGHNWHSSPFFPTIPHRFPSNSVGSGDSLGVVTYTCLL